MTDNTVGGSSELVSGSERAALIALVAWFIITVAWWAFALWPLSGEPTQLARARAVCFNTGPTGLPDASGWLLLIGQPIGMFAVLMVFAGDAVRGGVGWLRHTLWGTLSLGAAGLVTVVGLSAATVRVANAQPTGTFVLSQETPAATYPRLDREAPALGLVDQDGVLTQLDRFRGRPVLMTFAFGHCAEICPMVVHETRLAQQRLQEDGEDVAMVVVTLDPWRDTPHRLSALKEQWMLGVDGYALSGDVDQVNSVLDAWEVARQRDGTTGDIAHPALVFILDGEGRIAYAANGGASVLEELVARL